MTLDGPDLDRDRSDGPEGAGDQLPEAGDLVEEPTGGRRTALVAALVIGVLVALMVAVLATRDPSGERITDSRLIGRLAPTVEGPTLDGGEFDLDQLRGRWVVVNFFATWCVPCIQEHPHLVAFDEKHTALGDAAVVSVLFDDEPSEARQFFADNGGEWPVVLDDEGRIGVAYGVARVPESFLVAPDGTVVRRLVGGVTIDALDSLIETLQGAAT